MHQGNILPFPCFPLSHGQLSWVFADETSKRFPYQYVLHAWIFFFLTEWLLLKLHLTNSYTAVVYIHPRIYIWNIFLMLYSVFGTILACCCPKFFFTRLFIGTIYNANKTSLTFLQVYIYIYVCKWHQRNQLCSPRVQTAWFSSHALSLSVSSSSPSLPLSL